MVPIVENIDLFIVPVRLEAAGFSIEQATEQFGYLTGMAIPLIAMATIPTLSMAVSSLGLAMLITPHVGVAGPVLSNCVCVLAAQVIPYVIYIRRHRVRLWGGTA